MILALLLTVVATIPHAEALREQVTVIEQNHFYDDHGRHVFNQLIFSDWETDHFEVVAWILVKEPCHVPQFLHGGYVVVWFDAGKLRWVEAAGMRESWTQVDPELVARETLPKEKRRGLRP